MAQRTAIEDTINGMRRAVSGYHSSSDSDDFLQFPTNRGNKLKRRARFVREGQLNIPNNPRVYRRKITHANYERYVISRNPRRFDEDGYELNDDDTDEQADADAAARNPYHDIRLEDLLAPLTSAADLPNHPSLSFPYTSSTLSGMVQRACEMLHRERKTLWNAKNLLTKLRGDETWIPCGRLNSEIDDVIFDTESVYREIIDGVEGNSNFPSGQTITNGQHGPATLEFHNSPNKLGDGAYEGDENGFQRRPETNSHIHLGQEIKTNLSESTRVPPKLVLNKRKDRSGSPGHIDFATSGDIIHKMDEAQSPTLKTSNRMGGQKDSNGPIQLSVHNNGQETSSKAHITSEHEVNLDDSDMNDSLSKEQQVNQVKETSSLMDRLTVPTKEAEATSAGQGPVLIEQDESMGDLDGIEEGDGILHPIPHRMRTRAQAQAASENNSVPRTQSASPMSWMPPTIHPLFLMPQSAQPDGDMGLPVAEADEIRRMIMLYVQKQEEVCRGAEKLYINLLKADRMRKTVFKWCKAEGHIGEMSDGEDWYDKEEWGLDEDLRKGDYDEEEDAATQVKKTRGRRA